jgi:two-component system, NtrC family, sensor histidine kinase AtoS
MKSAPLVISLRNVHVSFESFKALSGIDFDLRKGEIHGLVGEHRAGKSTLVKLLSGAVKKDSGSIVIKDKNIDYFTPKTAMQSRIGIVYQDLNIIPSVNAVENIFSGQRIVSAFGFLNKKLMKKKAIALLSYLDTKINMDIPLSFLTKQEQQMIEIARALSVDPEVLILDEISSRLTPKEMEKIYKLLFELKKKGQSIIYISHNMDEIFRFADRVTILQDGHRKGTEEIKNIDKIKLIKLTYSFVLSRDELEKDNMELYLLKKYNESIIKNIPIGVVILDKERNISMVNLASMKLLDSEHSDIIGKGIKALLDLNLGEWSDEILSAIQEKSDDIWEDLSWRNEKIVTIKVFPLRDNDHKFIGSIMLLEDVSQERYFNDYLLRTEKIASIAELAAGVAHEINTPLSVVLNYIDLLKQSLTDSSSSKRLLLIENELNMISEIIGSLLSFTKIKQLPMKQVNIGSILTEVVLLVQHKIIGKKIHLIYTENPVDVYVLGEENRLKQVFINLLKNSIEAVLEGGHITINLDVKEAGWVEVSITDDGYGIPSDVIDKIFDPFFSTKAGKKNTGLGLSICQHIIESHQGIITCHSTKKTTMGIRLPVIGK